MDGDGRGASVGMAKLLVRAALAHFDEAQRVQDCDYLSRPENRDARHSVHDNGLRADEFRFELGLAVIEQHCDYLPQIRM
jgi:hypothetical protein